DCPAYYAKESRQTLQRQFPNRWIDRSREFPWPPHSPDLTSLDIFLWGTLKDKVYFNPPTTPENTTQSIQKACDVLILQTIENAVSSLRNRLHRCIEVEEHQFKHL
ncbi:hypothetical protein WN55_06229, partial [Dufourea novaeangliae]